MKSWKDSRSMQGFNLCEDSNSSIKSCIDYLKKALTLVETDTERAKRFINFAIDILEHKEKFK
jgi:hypothetical protein